MSGFDWVSAKAAGEAAIAVAGPKLAAPYTQHVDALAKIGPVYTAALTVDVLAARELSLSRSAVDLARWQGERRNAIAAADRAARRAERLELDARAGIPSAALVRNGSTFVLAPDVVAPLDVDAPTRTASRVLSASGVPVLRVSSKRAGSIGDAVQVSVAHGAGTTFTLSASFGAAYVEALAFSGPGALPSSELVFFEWVGSTRPDATAAVKLAGGAGDVFEFVRTRLERAAKFDSVRSIQAVLSAALASLSVLANEGPSSAGPVDEATRKRLAPFEATPAALIQTNPDGSIASILALAAPTSLRGVTVSTVAGMEGRLKVAAASLAPLVSAMTGPL